MKMLFIEHIVCHTYVKLNVINILVKKFLNSSGCNVLWNFFSNEYHEYMSDAVNMLLLNGSIDNEAKTVAIYPLPIV